MKRQSKVGQQRLSERTQDDAPAAPVDRVRRIGWVQDFTNLHRCTIWRLVRRGLFPPPIHLTERAIGWRESEIRDWINSRPTVGTPASAPSAA
jgi:prophage regulatory protein